MASLPLGPHHPQEPEAMRTDPRRPEIAEDKVFSGELCSFSGGSLPDSGVYAV